jgi:hypothetical protein
VNRLDNAQQWQHTRHTLKTHEHTRSQRPGSHPSLDQLVTPYYKRPGAGQHEQQRALDVGTFGPNQYTSCVRPAWPSETPNARHRSLVTVLGTPGSRTPTHTLYMNGGDGDQRGALLLRVRGDGKAHRDGLHVPLKGWASSQQRGGTGDQVHDEEHRRKIVLP